MVSEQPVGGGRTGRLPAHLRAERRAKILDAASAILVENGYEATTMDLVAERAQASKSTLYSWFGDKDGLTAAVIASRADDIVGPISAVAENNDHPLDLESATAALAEVSTTLLEALTHPATIVYDHAAITRPELIDVIYTSGRNRAGQIIMDFLNDLDASGVLPVPDPREAFSVFFGLTAQEMQSQANLGYATPSPEKCRSQGRRAAKDFVHVMLGRAQEARDAQQD